MSEPGCREGTNTNCPICNPTPEPADPVVDGRLAYLKSKNIRLTNKLSQAREQIESMTTMIFERDSRIVDLEAERDAALGMACPHSEATLEAASAVVEAARIVHSQHKYRVAVTWGILTDSLARFDATQKGKDK